MKKIFALCTMFFLLQSIIAQIPAEIYKKPLKEVLSDIEKRYQIKLQYSEGLVKDITVMYPAWRYRTETELTLTNILLPLDMVFEKAGENVYRVSKYEYYRKPAVEGQKHLEQLLASYPTIDQWEERKKELRRCFLRQMGLDPMPRKTLLNPIYTTERKFNGYTVQNVAIQTIPGYYLCGSLYKPSRGNGPFPAVLCPHGHFSSTDMNQYGRYRPDQQYRCATLARMGAVVFSYEMFAWGESLLQLTKEDHRTGLALTMQTLNSIRVLDFLTSLPYVNEEKIGTTAASGGGTQSFLITALDNRIAVSIPVVMVSSSFFGGCPCESGLPIHSCSALGTNNAEIAAMASPRPMLVISESSDWTSTVPSIEFPYLQIVYNLYGRMSNVENVHIENEEHNYGPAKRQAMYEFMARYLGLNINSLRDKTGKVDESKVTIEKYESLLVFGKEDKLPDNALHGADAVRKALAALQ